MIPEFIKNLVRPNILKVESPSSAREEFVPSEKEVILLDANESPFKNGVNRYPDPQHRQLKQVISELRGVPKEQLFFGNGSAEILDLILRIFCSPQKDKVIILPPSFGMYHTLSNINDLEIEEIPLDKNFQPHTEKILAAEGKLLFLCSPNNPTGNNIQTDILEEIISNFKGLVLLDEAYIDFSEQEGWIKKISTYPNLVVMQTFSKAWGMAGIRLGFCIAHPSIIKLLYKIKQPYNISPLNQNKALELLQDPEKNAQQIQTLILERELLKKRIERISFVKKVYPSDANFLLVKVDNANLRHSQLKREGLSVRNRSTFFGCENCLRITIGLKKENEHLLTIMKQLQ